MAGKRRVRLSQGGDAGHAPGDDGLVSRVEQLDLADGRGVAVKMAPVQAVAQEDADVCAAFMASQPDGKFIARPQQARGGVLGGEGGEPGDPVLCQGSLGLDRVHACSVRLVDGVI
jgi:hypothetical protein